MKALWMAAALAVSMSAQAQTCDGSRVTGMVRDTAGGLLPIASVSLDGGEVKAVDAEGRYTFPCVSAGDHKLHIEADAFGALDLDVRVDGAGHERVANVVLHLQEVDTAVDADAEGGNTSAGGGITLKGSDLMNLADDPDDLNRQIQQIGSLGGGMPGSATISIDGFKDKSTLPPKDAIAFIEANPDNFSAEYSRPPYLGGNVNIITKPSAGRVHGALFFEDSPTFANARDPLSNARAALGRRRYGFDLSMPVKPNRFDLALNLERREIDNFGVVNAVVLDSAFNQTTANYNVPMPQRLWNGSVRSSVQVSKKTVASLSYQVHRDDRQNVGAGGTTLQEAANSTLEWENYARGSVVTTFSPKTVLENRLGISLVDSDQTPNSTAPALNVSGAFTGGGSSMGANHSHEDRVEFDNDIVLTRGKHSIKAGNLTFLWREHLRVPTNFNGSFTFGGTNALPLDGNGAPTSNIPVAISGLEQYRRALRGYAGGLANTYNVTTGNAAIDYTLQQTGLFAQDQWKVNSTLQFALGFRWSFQNGPSSYRNFLPRLGVAYSPDKKHNLMLRGRVGLFSTEIAPRTITPVEQYNGVRQIPATYYNTSLSSPTSQPAASVIGTVYRFPRDLTQEPTLQSEAAVEYAAPRKWNLQAMGYFTHGYNYIRVTNINSPLNGDPNGPRPLAPNINIYSNEMNGHSRGNIIIFLAENHGFKRLGFMAAYGRIDLRTDADEETVQPQSAYSNAGEIARPSWGQTHNFFGNTQVHLPKKIEFSLEIDSASGNPYNIITGRDNNGDGVFNDRPFRVSAPGANVYATNYGLLATTGSGVTLGRNAATSTWRTYSDANLSRSFVLNPKAKQDRQQSISLNLRASNVLNHANVRQYGNVLGSPLFGKPLLADSGRRIEIGLRYSF